MKVIVQIPCYNEEATLPQTVADIPKQIPGIDIVEILIVDDGSKDRTVEIARELGVDHIVAHKSNKGLAASFRSGVESCLELGADIIVNTDGDNQYAGADIPTLIAPILRGEADIVVGDRETASAARFSLTKRTLQALGSWAVRRFSGIGAPDAVSGFRAISREAALKLNIVSAFSYTIEMLIQSGRKRLTVASVPVRTNSKTRESRLFTSIPSFIRKSATTMLRIYSMYHPLKAFFYLGAVLTLVGALPVLRFLYYYAIGQGGGMIQSLVLGGILVVLGLTTFLIGMLADLISFNRQLIEMTLERVRRIDLAQREMVSASNENDTTLAKTMSRVERRISDWDSVTPAPARARSAESDMAPAEPVPSRRKSARR